MSWTLAKVSLLLLFAQLAASITIQMKKNEQFCTWKHLDQDMDFTGEYIVSGYSEKKFGMTIYSPENKLLKKIEGKREGSWNLKVAITGEHKVCFRSFDNKQKYVTFNMNNGEVQDATVKTEYFEHMKDLVFDANRLLRKISQNQRFQNTRGMIHIHNAEALASRLNWTTFFKALILVGIAAGQLYVLTGFFRKRKASFV